MAQKIRKCWDCQSIKAVCKFHKSFKNGVVSQMTYKHVKKYRESNKGRGLCIYCPKVIADGSKTLCIKHLEEARVYQARVRDGFKKYQGMVKLENGGVEI